jgi:hypothetical protein
VKRSIDMMVAPNQIALGEPSSALLHMLAELKKN